MKKNVFYEYLGTNGVIRSPVHLEDTYYIRKIQLIAEEGKQLTKDNKRYIGSIIVPEDEVNEWKEV